MFTATEASGTMSVGLMISGGVFDRDVTVTVTTMERTATGRLAMVFVDKLLI